MSIEEIRKRLSPALEARGLAQEVSLRLQILPPTTAAGGAQAPEAESSRPAERREERSLAESLAQVVDEIRRLRSSGERQVEATEGLGRALEKSGGLSRAMDALPSRGGFGGGWVLSPIISGIAKLFGGGEKDPPPPPAVHSLPPSIVVEAGVTRLAPGVLHEIAREQGGVPRIVPSGPITVNVQAMDSRSFLDHSDEIARAVREAMLRAHGLNDVVNEL
jgi:hypothetical protein